MHWIQKIWSQQPVIAIQGLKVAPGRDCDGDTGMYVRSFIFFFLITFLFEFATPRQMGGIQGCTNPGRNLLGIANTA